MHELHMHAIRPYRVVFTMVFLSLRHSDLHLLATLHYRKCDCNGHVCCFQESYQLTKRVEYQRQFGGADVCFYVDCECIFCCGVDCAFPLGMCE